MDKTTQIIIGIIVAIIILGGIWYGVSRKSTVPTTKEPIKIGVITPLTGELSSWGNAIRKGLEIAKEESKDIKLTLIFEDSKCDPKEAVSAAQKLINVDKVKIIIGTVCSSETLAIAPITEENSIILMSIGASSPKITYAGDYVFRMWPSDVYEARVLVDYISKNLPEIKKVDLLYINNDFGMHFKDAVIKFSKDSGLSLGIVESFSPGSSDFKPQLTKIKQSGSEGLFVITYTDEAYVLFKQIKEFNLEKHLFAPGWVIDDKHFFEKSKELINGVMFAVPNIQVSEDFRSKIVSRYGSEGENLLVSGLAYDGLNIIIEALKICSENTVCIRDKLYNTKDYNGVTGSVTFDNNGDIINRLYVIKKVINGAIKEITK
jgi:branched-chain amino acid transport system substrate-binding protein